MKIKYENQSLVAATDSKVSVPFVIQTKRSLIIAVERVLKFTLPRENGAAHVEETVTLLPAAQASTAVGKKKKDERAKTPRKKSTRKKAKRK